MRRFRASGARLRRVDTVSGMGQDDKRIEWERRRRRVRRTQDIGLGLLALGVLVLAYLALTYAPS